MARQWAMAGIFGVQYGMGVGGWFLDYFVLFLFSFLTQHKAIDLQSGCIVVVTYDNCGCRFVRSSIFFFLNIKIV